MTSLGVNITEDPITSESNQSAHFMIQISKLPMGLVSYRTPIIEGVETHMSLDMISSVLSGGKSSRLYKKMVDDKKVSLSEVQAVNLSS
ncbi:MAG: hypothetical protein ACJZZ9_08655 [Cytophagales bacterium]